MRKCAGVRGCAQGGKNGRESRVDNGVSEKRSVRKAEKRKIGKQALELDSSSGLAYLRMRHGILFIILLGDNAKMDLQLLETKAHEIERAVRELLKEIRGLKQAESGPSLEEVIQAIQKNLPDEIDLDSTIEDIRDRQE